MGYSSRSPTPHSSLLSLYFTTLFLPIFSSSQSFELLFPFGFPDFSSFPSFQAFWFQMVLFSGNFIWDFLELSLIRRFVWILKG